MSVIYSQFGEPIIFTLSQDWRLPAVLSRRSPTAVQHVLVADTVDVAVARVLILYDSEYISQRGGSIKTPA